MSNEYMFRPNEVTLADRASADNRAAFITKTYLHLTGAVIAFIALLTVFASLPVTPAIIGSILGIGTWSWLLVMGAFMAVSYIADSWARNPTSMGMQYAGLSLYVIAFAMLCTVPVTFAMHMPDINGVGLVVQAGVLTIVAFVALTLVVFVTRMNFSFLGPVLAVTGLIALGTIAVSILFGFSLGMLFIGAMLIFATGAVLYQTSNVLHEFYIGQHVAASLALFASIGILFWYILQFVMAMARD